MSHPNGNCMTNSNPEDKQQTGMLWKGDDECGSFKVVVEQQMLDVNVFKSLLLAG